jgi:hypothetical protein
MNDTYYQAQMYRHGSGLDYGCEPRATQEEAEQDLRDCLGMMSERERAQSEVESHVRRFRVLSLEEDGSIGSAETF